MNLAEFFAKPQTPRLSGGVNEPQNEPQNEPLNETLKRDDNRMTNNRKICNSPVITAMNAATHMTAIWTDPIRKITSCAYIIAAHIFELHLFNRQVTWRIKGR